MNQQETPIDFHGLDQNMTIADLLEMEKSCGGNQE